MHPARVSSAAARQQAGGGLPYLIMSGVLWGTGGLLGTLLGRTTGLAAIGVATYRLAIGGALIVAFIALAGRRLPRGRPAATRIGAVAALAAIFQGCYFGAVSLTSVSFATLITIGTAPVLVLAVEQATGRRRADVATLGALGLALAGLALLVGRPAGGFPATAGLAGAGLAVASAAGFAAVTLLGTRPVPGLDDLTTVGLGFTAGGLLLTPLAAATTGLTFHPTAAAGWLLLALGTGPTAVAYTLYFRALRTASGTTATVLTLLEPLTAALLAALILGDRLGSAGIAGAGLLAAAMLLATRHPADLPGR